MSYPHIFHPFSLVFLIAVRNSDRVYLRSCNNTDKTTLLKMNQLDSQIARIRIDTCSAELCNSADYQRPPIFLTFVILSTFVIGLLRF